MIYITGDTHGSFKRIVDFCNENNTSKDDILIILGDAGINYYMDWRDDELKNKLSELPITLFCIHGNHEQRPSELTKYSLVSFKGGQAYHDPTHPNIYFAKDGEVFNFYGKRCLVVGGAYSVDKQYRTLRGLNWWSNEQPSEETKQYVEQVCSEHNWDFDAILTHTCPLKYEPVETFLPMIDQSTVDKSTEEWLDKIEDEVDYDKWYCGHYHTDKVIDNMRFLYKDIIELE